MDVTKPYNFIGFGAMHVTKPYNFTWFGDIDGRAGALRRAERRGIAGHAARLLLDVEPRRGAVPAAVWRRVYARTVLQQNRSCALIEVCRYNWLALSGADLWLDCLFPRLDGWWVGFV